MARVERGPPSDQPQGPLPKGSREEEAEGGKGIVEVSPLPLEEVPEHSVGSSTLIGHGLSPIHYFLLPRSPVHSRARWT